MKSGVTVFLFASLIFITDLCAQPFTSHPVNADVKPKLIVGIVIDQMRYDYLTRYWSKFGEGGFRKLVNEGFNCTNTHYNYIPTYTAPGHASIYTGTTPSVHGIISNDWFDRKKKANIYVTTDIMVKATGTNDYAGKMSPVNLLTTTFCDELKLASNLRSKVIGVALKDRSSILPAGRSADAAYWFESATGNFISSSWYMDSLPQWVRNFNDEKHAEKYKAQHWTTLLPIEKYVESTPDDNGYEDLFPGEERPVFPHRFDNSATINYEFIRRTPFGSTLTKDFALAAMAEENLGKDEFTDVLAISFSSPDYVGHQFGTHAIETQDTYLRLDKDLASLVAEIEKYCGKEDVLFFLTADHAAVQNVKFLHDQKLPGDLFRIGQLTDSINNYLALKYGNKKWILAIDNDQLFLDRELIRSSKLELSAIADDAAQYLAGFDGIAAAFTAKTLSENEFSTGIASMVQNGFNRSRSGDVAFVLQPGLVEYSLKGTTHGSPYTYDSHVPLIFYGWKVNKGLTPAHINITDIAPTISQFLGIQPPNGCTGTVIEDLLH